MNRSSLAARALLSLALAVAFVGPSVAQPAKPGYQAKVKVAAPTRIDWTFVLSNKSVETPPANWLPKDFDSAAQQYELFVPANYNPKQAYPVVLFVSPGNGPSGWKEWESVCKQQNIIFASPFEAGNNCPTQRRVRIVLDVLDDLRRNFNIDPDRTYITGFSGGGRIAAAIAFALPEYFGGVVPICATGDFRDENWLRQRLVDRLSVAIVTGDGDFNRGEVERYKAPWLTEVGVRTKVWTVPKMGHAIPGATQLAEVYKWLEEGLPRRRELAKKYPATRIAHDTTPSREEYAKALLAEGKQRIANKETIYPGLMVLLGCVIRYDGLPAAAEAKKILLEYDAKPEKPWDKEYDDEQRRFAYGRALGLTNYATGELPQQYAKERGEMAKAALELWEELLKDGKNAKAVAEAKKRIPELKKVLGSKD